MMNNGDTFLCELKAVVYGEHDEMYSPPLSSP